MEQPPLIRSIDTDRIYRVNTGTNRLMRMLRPEFGSMNLGCFIPSNLPLWTEGSSYAVGDDVYGRYDNMWQPEIDYAHCIYKCRVAHTATEANRPTEFTTTLHWQALARTSILTYPVCGSLFHGGAEPYGGDINRSPSGILIEVSGLATASYIQQSPETAWHHDYNGVYCMPVSRGWSIGGLCEGDLKWSIEFEPNPQTWGNCETGTRQMTVRHYKRTLSDSWWQTSFLFCGWHEILKCETSYTDGNLFPIPPDPPPAPGTPEYDAWRQSIDDVKPCCCPDYKPWQSPSVSGGGGTVRFLGFTDYMSVGLDSYSVEYFDNYRSANVRWRFALFGTGGKRRVLYEHIECDFFRLDFQGIDWNIFLGCTLEPTTPNEDGWFEKTVHVSDDATITDFGFTNVNACNWRYQCHLNSDLAGGTSYMGSLRQGA